MTPLDLPTLNALRALKSPPPPAASYFQASALASELKAIFENLTSMIQADCEAIMTPEDEPQPLKGIRFTEGHPGVSAYAETGLPDAAYSRLRSLEKLADALDTAHAASLKAFANTCKSEMKECLLCREILATDLIQKIRRIRDGCHDKIPLSTEKSTHCHLMLQKGLRLQRREKRRWRGSKSLAMPFLSG